MAQQRLRPGPWKLVNSDASNPKEIEIDYDKFDIPPSGTVEFEVSHMGLYDDTNLIAYRNPVQTVVSTSNVGQYSSSSGSAYGYSSPLGKSKGKK